MSDNIYRHGPEVVGKALDCLDSGTTGEISFMADAVQLLKNIVHDLSTISGNVEEVQSKTERPKTEQCRNRVTNVSHFQTKVS